MSALTYYKDNQEPSTREEMFQYIETLMIKKAYSDATDVFADLKRIELGETSSNVKKIVVDKAKEPLAQAKSLLANPLAWRMVQEYGSKTPTKTPTNEAIEIFRSIKLTHNDLLTLNRTAAKYQVALLTAHKGWDTDWVVDHFRNYDYNYGEVAHAILRNSPKMDAVLRVAESRVTSIVSKEPGHETFFGDGSNLDDETLFQLINMGFCSVIADPRVTEENIVKFWDDNFTTDEEKTTRFYQTRQNNFYSAITKNINTPSWLLNDVVNVYMRLLLPIEIYTHPNLSGEALTVLLSKTSDKEHRMLIARHPNVSMATLKKLSKSAYQPLAEIALTRWTEKDTERKKKQRRNF